MTIFRKELKAVSLYNLGSAFHTASLLLHFPPLRSTPAFCTPAFSTLAFLTVSHFPLLHFQSPKKDHLLTVVMTSGELDLCVLSVKKAETLFREFLAFV